MKHLVTALDTFRGLNVAFISLHEQLDTSSSVGPAMFACDPPTIPRPKTPGAILTPGKTIRPQSWDIPMDWVVTERGTSRRDPEGPVFLGEPVAGEPSALASPVCYAAEVDPGDFGKQKE